jgi:hypothetical protein
MPHQAHNPNNYAMTLMRALPQAIGPNPHTNLLNVQIANKMGLKKSTSCTKILDILKTGNTVMNCGRLHKVQ